MIKLNILSNTTLLNDISHAINYVASAIDMVTKNTNMTTTRQISDLNATRAGAGRGDYERGNHRGHGERGRGSTEAAKIIVAHFQGVIP
jgi:hypothetical protein